MANTSTRQAGKNGSGLKRKTSKTYKLALSEEERATLRKACNRYRSSVPIYLAFHQSEIEILDGVLRKLS